jgi:hypothetical protein
MRYGSIVLALLTVACSFGRASAADSGFSDVICPEAVQYMVALGKLRRDDPPQRIYDGAQAATNAYERCSKEKLAYGYREAQHYADTRAAGLAVVAARALVAMDRLDEAKGELEHWRALAQQVVDWQSETTAFQSADPNGSATTTPSDHRPSMYHAAAKEIVTVMDTELVEIAERSRGMARPQAVQPSPQPSP